MHFTKNNFETKLSQSVTPGQLTIQLDIDPELPYPYWLTIGDDPALGEIIEVTGKVGSNFTIVRGAQSTVTQEFPTGTLVQLLDTKGQWDEVQEAITKLIMGDKIDVRNFGAKGDGSTDDTLTIKSALTQCKTGDTLYFPHIGSGYKVTGTIAIPENINVIMDSPIIYSGTENIPAIIVGNPGVNNEDVTLKLNVIRETFSDWSDENCVGIKLINPTRCNIEILRSKYFSIGVQFIGSGSGSVYNNVILSDIYSNKVGLDLTNESYLSKIGWCNENVFIGGSFSIESTLNTSKNRYGVRITSKDITYLNNNNNVFLKPSFELRQSGTIEAIPILVEHGRLNTFHDIRNESNSSTVARFLNDSNRNVIIGGYEGFGYKIETTISTNQYIGGSLKHLTNSRVLYNLNNIGKLATPYDYVNSYTHVMGLVTLDNGGAYKYNSNLIINNDNLEIAPGKIIGVFVDCNEIKDFILGGERVNGYGGRIRVICYNESGNQLSTDGGYVIGQSDLTTSFSTDYGGSYQTNEDANTRYHFKVTDAVKKIFVGFSSGLNPCRLRSFSLETTDLSGNATVNIEPNTSEMKRLAIQPPKIGFWNIGDTVYNDLPPVGGPQGWICVTSGTPGVWKAFGYGRKTLHYLSNLADLATPYDNTEIHIMGLSIMDGVNFYKHDNALTINTDNIEIGFARAIGAFVDTREAKDIFLHGERLPGYGGRIIVVCYDANGSQLTGDGYIVGSIGGTTTYYDPANYGGSYRTGGDAEQECYIQIADPVKKIFVGFTRGTNACRIKSFIVSTSSTEVLAPITVSPNTMEMKRLASQIPTTGTWIAGEKIYNDSPSPGGYVGWVCVTSGTPGTWKGFGLIAS